MDLKQPRGAIAAGTVDFMIESLFAKRLHVQPQPFVETATREMNRHKSRVALFYALCVRRLSEKLTQILAGIMRICFTCHHASIVNVTLHFPKKKKKQKENQTLLLRESVRSVVLNLGDILPKFFEFVSQFLVSRNYNN